MLQTMARVRSSAPDAIGSDLCARGFDVNGLTMKSRANWPPFVDAASADMLRILREFSETADLPPYEALRQVAAKHPPCDPRSRRIAGPGDLAEVEVGALARAFSDRCIDRALSEVVEASAALLVWRAGHHGALPATLAEAITRVPTDPFDGRPLRYQRVGSGFVMWSVGPSGGGSRAIAALGPPTQQAIRFCWPQTAAVPRPPTPRVLACR